MGSRATAVRSARLGSRSRVGEPRAWQRGAGGQRSGVRHRSGGLRGPGSQRPLPSGRRQSPSPAWDLTGLGDLGRPRWSGQETGTPPPAPCIPSPPGTPSPLGGQPSSITAGPARPGAVGHSANTGGQLLADCCGKRPLGEVRVWMGTRPSRAEGQRPPREGNTGLGGPMWLLSGGTEEWAGQPLRGPSGIGVS
jgi:hypothetical protein